MSPSLDKYLCERYSAIFADRNKPMTETCMCWGMECEDGWFHLIDTLCESIQHQVDNPQWVPKKGVLWSLKRGWNNVVKVLFKNDMFSRIRYKLSFMDQYEEPPHVQVVASQIKEKFGGLRFYVNGANSEINNIINFAEHLSYHICEECGKMDETVVCFGKGWIRTLCYECRCKFHSNEQEDHFQIMENNVKKMKALAEATDFRKNRHVNR